MLKTNKEKLLSPGAVMRKDDYLPLTNKADLDKYDTMGFIGVHKSLFDNKWVFSSPLFLVDDQGNRPRWELARYKTFEACLMAGINIARKNDTFVVIIDDPLTNKTMQPSRGLKQV